MVRVVLKALFVSALIGVLPAASQAVAQNYPNRPITLVVPFPAGGLSDIPARIMAPELQAVLGAPVVVENKPGGSGVLGASQVWRAEPDGYTILVNAISDVQNLHYLSVPYNAVTDFEQVAMITDGPPLVLMVNAATPYRTLSELIEDSKKNPTKVNFATSGPATSPAIAVSQLNSLTGANILQVPYRGTAPGAAAILSGEVQGGFVYYATAKQLHDGGKARAIAITSAKRLSGWQDLPTMVELGYPAIVHSGFVGLSAPLKTPPEVIDLLNKSVNKVIQTPEFRRRMDALGMTVPSENTPQVLTKYMTEETAKQRELATQSGHSVGNTPK